VVAALAAYNAGETNVVAWGGSNLQLDDIPFPETRGYVEDVLDKRAEYARHYRHELGLD
jgi:soluble lytic murein transglycosylase-like protein